ncbi:penicillin acylase family protein [Microbacteriaceae bacterium VKM Ac-2854]|nr:penicillin acylase family protein [Microbacteriaceae bacterium VKM Ac-2854]
MASEVRRDAWGIPSLWADSELELVHAQGRITAQDRAWQIETDRWRAEGRLAEHLGAAELEWDRFAHRAMIADTAQRAYAELAAEDRAWVDAHVRGVNSGLTQAWTAPEFAGLEPTPWPAWAPLGVFLVNHILFSTFPHLLWRQHVVDTLGEPALAAAVLDAWGAESGPGSGSNAWAVHGSRTATGLPLLAGDPHRLYELPGIYQQIGLACPEYDVIGLAFPGVPGLPHFGHTGAAAWGVTNALAHSAELFRETLRPGEALGPDGWEPTRSTRVTLRVRGGASEQLLRTETARGPVIIEGERTYSLRLPARVLGDLGFRALRPLLRARTATEVTAAFSHWVDPVNRVLAADDTGSVRRMTAGRVPQRRRAERILPHDAATVRAAPWRELPGPGVVTAIAVDANERDALDLGAAYAPGHRARRIRALLNAGEDVHPDTLVDAGPLLALLTNAGPLPLRAEVHRRELLAWNHRMDADSRGAAVYAAWRSALVRRLAAHPALAALQRPHAFGALFDPWLSVHGRIADALPRLLTAGLGIDARAEALAALGELGRVSARWGDTHRLPPALGLASVPLGGDTEAIRCTSSLPGVTDTSVRGSVARWIWDLADRGASRWGVPFGASGDPRSPHYADQLDAWSRAETIPVPAQELTR